MWKSKATKLSKSHKMAAKCYPMYNISVNTSLVYLPTFYCTLSKFVAGMLEKAIANVETAKKSGSKVQAEVTFSQDDITSMPGLLSESFDALCNNQVNIGPIHLANTIHILYSNSPY